MKNVRKYWKIIKNARKYQKVLDNTNVILVIKFYQLINFYNFYI